MLQGKQSWTFVNKPVIISSAVVGGPDEAKGPLSKEFDFLYDDLWIEQASFEKAEQKMLSDACDRALKKANLKNTDLQFFLSGDLMNQIISSNFTARQLGVSFLGLFGACSTSMEGLALGSILIDGKSADKLACGTVSHNASVEKQFRYPTEYGSQKPPCAQWTVTGAGVAILAQQGIGPKVTSATIGKVIDMGLKDPFNMGAAMAPAAVDTLITHFQDLSVGPQDYDLILTGDLGKVGYEIAYELLQKKNCQISKSKYKDCGLLIYGDNPDYFSGGSGCGCSATVVYGHILKKMQQGVLNKVLIIATGALLSPLSYQQNESIPCIAHAVSISNF